MADAAVSGQSRKRANSSEGGGLDGDGVSVLVNFLARKKQTKIDFDSESFSSDSPDSVAAFARTKKRPSTLSLLAQQPHDLLASLVYTFGGSGGGSTATTNSTASSSASSIYDEVSLPVAPSSSLSLSLSSSEAQAQTSTTEEEEGDEKKEKTDKEADVASLSLGASSAWGWWICTDA